MNKTDKQLRRYLKSISNKVQESKAYKSVHYYIDDIHIRFSDHFSPRDEITIDIIKCTEDVYRINSDYLQVSVYADNLLAYVKSLLLLYPAVNGVVDKFASAAKSFETKYNIVNKAFKKLQTEMELVDLYVAEKNEAENAVRACNNVIKDKNRQLNDLRNSKDSLSKENVKLKNELSNLKQKFSKLKSLVQ